MKDGIVYSTEKGRLCPNCEQPVAQCCCRANATAVVPSKDGFVRVARETKGRKGKVVSVVHGLPLAEPALRELAKALKQRCGTGGSVKDGTIELQGEHLKTLGEELRKRGYKVKGC